ACTIRPISSAGKPNATAESNVPPEKEESATRNTCRGVNRSSRNPVVGMTTAIVTRKPLISHCTVVVSTSISSARCGSAMDTIVSFRIITNAATTITPMISPGLDGIAVRWPVWSLVGPAVSDTLTPSLAAPRSGARLVREQVQPRAADRGREVRPARERGLPETIPARAAQAESVFGVGRATPAAVVDGATHPGLPVTSSGDPGAALAVTLQGGTRILEQ